MKRQQYFSIGEAWRRALIEIGGVVAVLALGAIVLAHLSTSPRSWVLFYDGDSVLPLLVQGSMRVGQPVDWALSSPLFVVEAILYVPVLALDLSSRTTMLMIGVINWFALYGGARAVAGALRLPRRLSIASAVLVVLAISLLALTESSADRNALELSSLLSTATYYAPTAVATIVLIALAAGVVRAPSTRLWLLIAGVVGISTLSNPIVIAWGVVPIALVGAIVALRFRLGAMWIRLVLTMGAGVALGMLARVPFASVFVQSIDEKFQPERVNESALYYLGLASDQLDGATGWIELVLFSALLAGAGAVCAQCWSSRWAAGALVSGVAAVGPLIVVVGAVVTGTFAARYLQPVAFLPTLAVIPACRLTYEPMKNWVLSHRRVLRMSAAGLAVLVASGGLAATATLFRVSSQSNPSVACVVRWIEKSARSGAGEFWTIRAPKSELRDPRQLVQIDSQLNEYPWLVNRADFRDYTITFLVRDTASLDGQVKEQPGTELIGCGEYTILDFGSGSVLSSPDSG